MMVHGQPMLGSVAQALQTFGQFCWTTERASEEPEGQSQEEVQRGKAESK